MRKKTKKKFSKYSRVFIKQKRDYDGEMIDFIMRHSDQIMKQILFVVALVATLTAQAGDFSCTTNTVGKITLTGYTGTNRLVVVPDYVTTIADYAFRDNKSIKSVFIPDSITELGTGAFWCDSGLSHVRLSPNIVTFGLAVFQDCYRLDYIYDQNATAIKDYCGYKWWSLGSDIKPWIDYSVDANVITIVYEGTLQKSSNLKDWVDVDGNGLHKIVMTETLYFRSVNNAE